jgi:enoyl-CoA hydratase/carnithine racemase
MTTLVSYRHDDQIATISLDDGKVNVLSLPMLSQVNAALDRAGADGGVVVLSGRAGVFSAGFDLGVLRGGGQDALDMLRAGFELAERLLQFPAPVLAVCTGHAVAMGAFLLLSADYRIGAAGPFKITANEVAIGLTMPRAAVEICRQRLAPQFFHRTVALAEPFTPGRACEAGFLDRVAGPGELPDMARHTAVALGKLDMTAHAATKRRAREPVLNAVRAAIEADSAEFAARQAGPGSRPHAVTWQSPAGP